MIAAFLLACTVGLSQWRADRILSQCDGSAPDTACYVLQRKILTPVIGSVCCDETCSTYCVGLVGYDYGAWSEVDRVDEPGIGTDVCFDWDASAAGVFTGSLFPPAGEVWWLDTYALDGAGNRSQPCGPTP